MSESYSRDSSPVRKQKRNRHAAAPLGFRRNTCPIGHACSNARCYQSIANPGLYWDQKLSSKPYYPEDKSKYDFMDIPLVEDKKEKKHKKHHKKHRKTINTSAKKEKTEEQVELEKDIKLFQAGQRSRYPQHMSMMQKLKADGCLIPGTPEYEAKLAQLRATGVLPSPTIDSEQ